MRGVKTMIVFRKELRDTFRDRSTILSVLVLPLVIYPLMFIGMGLLFGMQRQGEERRIAQVAVAGGPCDQRLLALLRDEPKIALVELPEPRPLLEAGDIQAVLEFKPQSGDGRLSLAVFYDEASRNSAVARDRLKREIEAFQDRLIADRLIQKGIDTMLLAPVKAEYRNVASAQKMGGFIMGMIIPYMIIMLVMVGALHTAMDTTAGEKERKTIETLLVSNIGRREIIAGKLLTAVVMGLITAFIGLCSLGLTVLSGISIFTSGARQSDLSLSVSPVGMLLSFVTVLPAAMLLASLLLTLGCYARSVKEGNSYAQYFMMAVLMLAMVTITPMEPPRQLFLIPVLNTALCQKELLMGTVNWAHLGITLLVTGLLAAAAFVFAVAFFQREEVLFRS
ncbi:MAG: ABC transporter permease subunit [Candidatus Edwardsbacteria bacterium]|nr:ABC transporter permease subunit [Candidatus Edwardsbacteria bacterium]